jgi:hypothetical protein
MSGVKVINTMMTSLLVVNNYEICIELFCCRWVVFILAGIRDESTHCVNKPRDIEPTHCVNKPRDIEPTLRE